MGGGATPPPPGHRHFVRRARARGVATLTIIRRARARADEINAASIVRFCSRARRREENRGTYNLLVHDPALVSRTIFEDVLPLQAGLDGGRRGGGA